MGGLMRKFKSSPQQITRFFDVSLLCETAEEPKQRMKGRISDAENGTLVQDAALQPVIPPLAPTE